MNKKYFKKNAIGVDLGGTNVRVGIVNSSGKILNKKSEPVKKKMGTRAVIFQMIEIINAILKESKLPISGIGIGVPGPHDQKRGLILSASNLGWKNIDVVTPFKKEFRLPVFLDNDANVAALAEWKFGAGRKAKHMIYLTISTGIGAGIIIDEKLYRGRGNAGEIGHMIIDMKSKAQSSSGIFGDLESLSSGTGIENQAQKSSKEIFEMVKIGDKKAKKILDSALTSLGIGLVNCFHIFDPEVVVLGGSVVINNQDIVFPFLRKFVKKKAMPDFKNNVKIVPAKLGSDSGLVGAAVLVFESLGGGG